MPLGRMSAYASADLPGIGAPTRILAEDLRCEEVPRRPPSGDGAHWWVQVRKTDIATGQARKAVARAAGIAEDLVACAGSRDRRGTCLQWFSVPAEAFEGPGPLRNVGYQNKLRSVKVVADPKRVDEVGVTHLRWNLRLRGVGGSEAYQKAKPILDLLRREGIPNFVPPALFGREGELARWGRLLCQDQPLPGRLGRDVTPGRCLWAFQHWLFNRWVAERLRDGCFDRAVEGDVIATRSGETTVVTDADHASRRCASWEAVVQGPLFGEGCTPAAAEALAREASILADLGLTADAIARLRGGRRALRFQPLKTTLEIEGQDLNLQADLPCEAHLQVLIDELCKPS